MTVFNGFRLLNSAKQNRLNREASELEKEAAQQDLVLNVTLAYLQVFWMPCNKIRYTNKKKHISTKFTGLLHKLNACIFTV